MVLITSNWSIFSLHVHFKKGLICVAICHLWWSSFELSLECNNDKKLKMLDAVIHWIFKSRFGRNVREPNSWWFSIQSPFHPSSIEIILLSYLSCHVALNTVSCLGRHFSCYRSRFLHVVLPEEGFGKFIGTDHYCTGRCYFHDSCWHSSKEAPPASLFV